MVNNAMRMRPCLGDSGHERIHIDEVPTGPERQGLLRWTIRDPL
jgi:hypothetical protein